MESEKTVINGRRRIVLKTLGSTVGATSALSNVAATSTAADGGRVDDARIRPLEVDEADMPIEKARCWMVNGTDAAVDVYVNYDTQPLIGGIEPLSIGSVLDIDGSANEPYGTYTFEAREKDGPDGPVLAAASVDLDEGDSFSAVFHQIGTDQYQLSIYLNDYSPSANARFEVRHTARPEQIDWQLSPNGENPEIPTDERDGTLERGQWQQAADVTENNYLFEVFVDGEVVTLERDVELQVEATYVCYVVGAPEPLNIPSDNNYESTSDSGLDEGKWILVQAFEVPTGSPESDTVSAPAEPVSTSDQNHGIVFDCDPLELFETNVVEREIGATDPDGIVTGLAVDQVDPASDDFVIVDNSVDRADAIGGTTTATLRVRSDASPGTYEVRIVANPESLGERATCTVPVEVKQITVQRLQDLVEQYRQSGEIDESIANELHDLLDDATAHLDADQIGRACAALKEVLDVIGTNKGTGVSETALNDLQPETKALRTRLGCG